MNKIICCLTILLSSGVATAGERLTGAELKAFFSDKTIVGEHFKSGEQKFYFSSDGLVHSQSKNGNERIGKWWINKDGNKRCVEWSDRSKKLCHYVERNADGSHSLIHGKKGKKLVEISETVDGNQL